MLYVRRDEELCVFRIDPSILGRKEVIITNQNAAKDEAEFSLSTSFKFSPESSTMLRTKYSYLWKDKETGKTEKKKAVRQAEVLVPYQVHPSFIRGIYVPSEEKKKQLLTLFSDAPCPVPIDIHPSLFFSSPKKDLTGANPLESIKPQPLSHAHFPQVDMSLPESSDEETDEPRAVDDSGIFTMEE